MEKTKVKKRTIGTTGSDYAHQRNIIQVPYEKYQVKKTYDLFKILNYTTYKIFNYINPVLNNMYSNFLSKEISALHFFNSVAYTSIPWITTFETSLPRWQVVSSKGLKVGLRLLARKNCHKILALSKNAQKIQLAFLEKHYPEFLDILKPKIEVLMPPQKMLIKSYQEKRLPKDCLRFVFVGRDFFRKGGKEMVHVFERLIEEGQQVELQIVSALKYGDYASKASAVDQRNIKEIIQKYPQQIQYFESLPNEKVLALFANAHIALLPTYDDTFGYSVLEAQALGCPVISTNVRALPEINKEELGWLIKMPKNETDGRGLLQSTQERVRFSQILEEQLYATIMHILKDTTIIEEKGRKSLQNIAENHSPLKHAAALEKIFDQMLA